MLVQGGCSGIHSILQAITTIFSFQCTVFNTSWFEEVLFGKSRLYLVRHVSYFQLSTSQ